LLDKWEIFRIIIKANKKNSSDHKDDMLGLPAAKAKGTLLKNKKTMNFIVWIIIDLSVVVNK